MKKVLAVGMLMACALAAQAQLMGPGYIMGNQQEKVNHPKAAKIYKALYEAAEKNDCATFRKILDTGINPNLIVKERESVEPRIEYKASWYEEASDPDYTDGHRVPGHLFKFHHVGEKQYCLYAVAKDAVGTGKLCILKELQAHKFNWKDPDWSSGNGYLLLHSIENKQIDVVKFFLSLPGPEGDMIRWRERDVKDAQALVAEADAKAAKSQQKAVQREVKASLSKKK